MIVWNCPTHGQTDAPIILESVAYCPVDPCTLAVQLVSSPAKAPKREKRQFAHANGFGQADPHRSRTATCVSVLATHCARCGTLIPPQTEFVGVSRGTKREDVCRTCLPRD